MPHQHLEAVVSFLEAVVSFMPASVCACACSGTPFMPASVCACACSGTPFMALVAVYNVLLARYLHTDDIVIATPFANRGDPQFREVSV